MDWLSIPLPLCTVQKIRPVVIPAEATQTSISTFVYPGMGTVRRATLGSSINVILYPFFVEILVKLLNSLTPQDPGRYLAVDRACSRDPFRHRFAHQEKNGRTYQSRVSYITRNDRRPSALAGLVDDFELGYSCAPGIDPGSSPGSYAGSR
jgi:hypothetical protein